MALLFAALSRPHTPHCGMSCLSVLKTLEPRSCMRLQACHNVVRRAWAKTTRTYDRTQRQRRPTYRLRQSSGMGRAGEQECGKDAMPPPAVAAAQHKQRAC